MAFSIVMLWTVPVLIRRGRGSRFAVDIVYMYLPPMRQCSPPHHHHLKCVLLKLQVNLLLVYTLGSNV